MGRLVPTTTSSRVHAMEILHLAIAISLILLLILYAKLNPAIS